MTTELTRAQLLGLRQRAQLLTGDRLTVAGTAERLLAMQGQDLPGALWSLGLRSGSTINEVRASFDRGELVRCWPLRGTLHVVPARDLGWLQLLTADRARASMRKRHQDLGIDAASESAARHSLHTEMDARGENRRLTRAELFAAWERDGIATGGQRGAHLLWLLSLDATLVYGPFAGAEQQLVLGAEWIASSVTLDQDAAVRELVQRYLRGHGPATLADLQYWCKLPLATLRSAADELGDSLAGVQFDGARHLVVAEALDEREPPKSAPTLLLPGFDEWVLGYQDRSASVHPDHADLIVPGGNGMFRATVVHRGRCLGLWSKTTTAKRTRVVATPISGTFSAPTLREAAAQVERYAAFLGVDGTLSVGESLLT
ncbi:winged helix DNA-binding domain-containing protein [Pseudoclavibacter terrae]|uniref:winged helix DNA-binding domain-containing protein n=1 Tax=Pseudoclavibacter terrae TaxID=1530195 RepID=UPI00232C69DE|nr:winged helix DNA-binding domain-containing protein [Pseudoclavibacter terrae]